LPIGESGCVLGWQALVIFLVDKTLWIHIVIMIVGVLGAASDGFIIG
jgi:hypothetical protein